MRYFIQLLTSPHVILTSSNTLCLAACVSLLIFVMNVVQRLSLFLLCCFRLSKTREAPPTSDEADQSLPKRLVELNKVRQLIREGKYGVKKRKNKNKNKKPTEKPPISSAQFVGPQDRMLPGMKRPEKAIPTLQQRPGEADKAFLHRCSQICDVSCY